MRPPPLWSIRIDFAARPADATRSMLEAVDDTDETLMLRYAIVGHGVLPRFC